MERIVLDQVLRSSSFIIFLKTLLPQIFEKPIYSGLKGDHRCQFLIGCEGKMGLPGEFLLNFLM